MKITHTTYNEVRGGTATPIPPPTTPPLSTTPEFLTTPAAFRFSPTPPLRSNSPISNPLRNTTRRIKLYIKTHIRFRTPRPGSQRFSRSRHGTSIRYPPGEMHPATVPTQVGKYHSGSVRGSISSMGGEERVVVRGSQAYEKGLEQRYKHVRGKKRSSYLKPREEVGGRKSGGEWGFELGVGGLDFEAYMKQQKGLERDFGKGYNGGISPPSPQNGNPPRNNSPPRNISPPNQHSLVPREDAGGSKRTLREGKGFEQGMTPMDLESYMKQQRALERDFGKGYGYGDRYRGHSPSPPNSPPRARSPRTSRNHSPTPIPVPTGYSSETGTGTGNTSLGDSVRFSDVQWSSVGSGGSGTGTTGTMESGTHADSPKARGAGTGKHKAAPGQRKLRRKQKFEERDQSPATTPASSRSQTISKEDEILGVNEKARELQRVSKDGVTTMEQLEMMRTAMWNGKLEKVIPPSQIVPKHTDVLQPATPSSTSSKNSGNSQSKGKGKMVEGRVSPIQKLKVYMGHGAEVVDDFFEKRKGSKTGSKLPSPFEYLLYPTYDCKGKGKSERNSTELKAKSKGKEKGKEGGEDSDEELWGCVGEQNNKSGILNAPHFEETTFVVEGAEPEKPRKESHTQWENLCKLCRNHGSNGPRGFCRTCEENFLNTKAWEETTADFSDDSDVPPTPPLKDRHITSMREMLATTPPNYSSDPNYRPSPPMKDSIHVLRVENSRPQLVNPLPVRQESQRLIYGGMGDSPGDIEIGFREWQTDSLAIEGAKTEQMFKRWSETFRGGELRGGVDEESGENGHGGEEGEKEEQSPRDSTFYDFWGAILKEGGRPETPKLEDRKPGVER